MTETLEHTARRIAEKGRAALLGRLRPAFEEAAAAHADVLELDEEQVERMVQRAVDKADGLQWRRALAAVATEELGIGLGEALGHPAVARAQRIIGAPSYEESLAALTGGDPPDRVTEAVEVPTVVVPESEAVEAPVSEVPESEEEAGAVREAGAEAAAGAQESASGEGKRFPIFVGVTHLDGLAELDGEGELELRFDEDGLTVVRQRGGASLLHFDRQELVGLEVRPGRARMLRRRAAGARLILTATDRHARFEARGGNAEELIERLAPVLGAFAGGDRP